jgi:asparagine synthase (glutamine-hydrolysing)
MCGIAGQARSDGRAVEQRLLERMCSALEHRGPDARGTFARDGVGLAIQRLRVIDLETGDQPVFNESGSVAVVLNGEIYNFRELRADLQRRGHRFRTNGDTEVIAHLYEEHGPQCVKRLHGMFAFALWDQQHRRLVIGRDRIGKKPLFYASHRGTLSFASELRALLQDRAIPRELDLGALDRYLALGYVPAPMSAHRAVRKLPPAHLLIWQDGRLRLERYWQLDYSQKRASSDLEEIKEALLERIRVAVRRRLIADVPLGAFLSGGIDSSAVVAAMASSSARPVKTFSIGFDRPQFDELPYARMVAEQFATEHHEFVVEPASIDLLPRIARHHGEPFADSSSIPCFILAELTREHVTVALNGDGGDESFGGYTRYVSNALAARLDRLPRPLRAAAARAGELIPAGGAVGSLPNRARRISRSLAMTPSARYSRYVNIWDDGARARLWSNDVRAEIEAAGAAPDVIADAWAAASGSHVVDVMLEVDATTYLPDDLIAKVDIATMAHSLEARSPLLDHELMEFAASLPADMKVRGTEKKWLLREALRGTIPDAILDRPKQGFSVPISDWFRDELRDWVREVLLDPGTVGRGWFEPRVVEGLLDRHAAGVDDDQHRIWSLLMLELWQRECVDGAAVSEARAVA